MIQLTEKLLQTTILIKIVGFSARAKLVGIEKEEKFSTNVVLYWSLHVVLNC